MNKTINRKKQGGFTLLEILIAAVIIALVAGIVGPLLTETKDKNVTVGQEISLMRATLANIDDRYWDEPITTDLDNEELMAGRILPQAVRQAGTDQIYNLFGGTVTITGIDDDGLEWVSQGVPEGVCAKFVDDARSLGFETVDVAGTSVDYTDRTLSDNATITQACDGAGTNGVVTITFRREPAA